MNVLMEYRGSGFVHWPTAEFHDCSFGSHKRIPLIQTIALPAVVCSLP